LSGSRAPLSKLSSNRGKMLPIPRLDVHRPGFDLLTLLCVGLIVVQAMLTVLGPGFAGGVYVEFGLTREGVLDGGLWQLVTHAFLHGGWMHVMVNVVLIYLVGGRIYHILGGGAFCRLFGGGILLGALFHLLFNPSRPIPADPISNPLVGASGGAMALLMALTGLSPDSRMWPIPVSGKNLGRGFMLSMILLYVLTPGVGIPVLSDIGAGLAALGMEGIFRIGHMCHFGGALMGVLYARRLLRRPVTLEELQRDRARREGAAA